MSGSARGKQPALKLIALSFALFGLLSGIVYGLHRQSVYEQIAQDRIADYAKHARDKINQSCVGITSAERTICLQKAKTEYELERRNNERDEYDLISQRRSALWTAIMGVAALVGMGLSAVGIWLVWTTFRETKRSADEAYRSVQAFIEAERAILHVIGGDVGRSNLRPEVSVVYVNVINRGRAAARIVNMGTIRGTRNGDNGPAPRWTVVGPGETVQITLFDAPDRDTILSDDCWFEYRTLGQETHRTHFNVNVSWFDPPERSLLLRSRWFVNTSNENGHPSDT